MASAPIRQPAFQAVNSGGTVIEGPYLFNVGGGAPTTLGVTLATVNASEEAEMVGPWKNFAWSQMAFPLGYRLHATLNFTSVESDPASQFYGLTLLHRLWRWGVETQFPYPGLQFRMFTSSAWRPVVISSFEWRPSLMAGKQGLYEVDLTISSFNLLPFAGEWAQSAW